MDYGHLGWPVNGLRTSRNDKWSRLRSMRNDITRVTMVATEPEVLQNEVFGAPRGFEKWLKLYRQQYGKEVNLMIFEKVVKLRLD